MESMKHFYSWYLYTARIVGAPILAFLLIWGTMKITYTGTCMIGGLKCEQSIGADQGLADYMGNLLASNPGTDIITKPRR